MKAIKRTVAALLATLMLATSTSFVLAAEEYSDKEAVVVAKVNAAGIMQGTDKGFEPSKSLTRAEAAAIIVRMKGISESAVKGMAGTTLFNDVAASHWASGYVNEASNLGIVKGVSATEFAPDREVTVSEFVTMAIRALGAGTMVDAQGTWPTNYVNFANEEGLLDDVTAVYTATASRMNAATIVANALEAKMWAKTSATTNNEVTYSKTNDTILHDVLNIDWLKGVTVSEIDKKDREFDFAPYVDDKATLTVEGTYAGSIAGFEYADSIDLNQFKVGDEIDVWFKVKTKDIILVVPAEESTQVSVKFDKIAKDLKDGKTVTVTVEDKDKKYDLHKNEQGNVDAIVYYNGDKITTFDEDLFDESEYTFGTLLLANGKVTYAYLESFEGMGIVDEVTSKKVKYDKDYKYGTTIGKSDLTIDEDNIYDVTLNGEKVELDALEAGDVYFFYSNNDEDEFKVVAYSEAVKGTVKKVDSTNKVVRIDSTDYDFAAGLSFELKDEIVAYTDNTGRICAYKVEEGAKSDVAIISYFKEYEDKYGYANADVKLTYLDGTVSDVLSVNVEESLEKIYGGNFKEETGATTYTDGSNHYDLDDLHIGLGVVIPYSVSGDTLTVKKLKDEFVESTNMDLTIAKNNIALTNKEDDVADPDTGWDLEEKANGEKATLASDAKVFVIKESTKSNTVKVEEIDKDAISKSNGLVGALVGIDGTKADYLIVDETDDAYGKLDRTVEQSLFAMVISQTEVYYDDDDDKDIEYDVVFSDGTRKNVYYVEGISDEKVADDAILATLVELTLKDDVVISVEDVENTDDTTYFDRLAKTDAIECITSLDDDMIDNMIYVADEAIILKEKTKSGKTSYEVKSISDLSEVDEDYETGDEFDQIKILITCDLDDDVNTDPEVVFILYKTGKSN